MDFRKPGGDLQSTSDNFTDFFLYKALDLYTRMILEEIHFPIQYQYDFLTVILRYLSHREQKVNSDPQIALQYNFLMLIMTQNYQYYFKLKDLMNKYQGQLDDQSVATAYTGLINYLNRRPSIPNLNIDKELYSITSQLVQLDTFANGKYLDDAFFMNHVIHGIRLKEHEATREFVYKYGDRLPGKNREDTIILSESLLLFEQGDYKKTIRALEHINKSHWFYHLHKKNLLLKCYYELNELNNAVELIDSYKHFLTNNNLIYDNIKKSNNYFVKFTEKLIRIDTEKGEIQQAILGMISIN